MAPTALIAVAPFGPEVFDPGVLRAMFGDEVAVVTSVLDTFLSSMAGSLVDMKAAALAHDLAAMAAVAHRIKGSARMSGAHALAHAAIDVERSARGGDLPEARSAVETLERQWQRVLSHPDLLRYTETKR